MRTVLNSTKYKHTLTQLWNLSLVELHITKEYI